jgi:hypothetical protein
MFSAGFGSDALARQTHFAHLKARGGVGGEFLRLALAWSAGNGIPELSASLIF